MTVSGLLTASMARHKQAAPQGRGMTRPSNWRALMHEARALRLDAVAQDPDRKDQAWIDEGINTHAQMMRFYGDLFGGV